MAGSPAQSVTSRLGLHPLGCGRIERTTMTEPVEPFAVHPQLAKDSAVVGDLQLSRVLLMNNVRFPWLLLVPRLPDIREFVDLPDREQAVMWSEMLAVSRLVTS